DAKNTVLKMAQKRAKIQAVIGVTRTSGLFTQDLDEHEFSTEKITPVAEPASTVVAAPAPVNGGKEETHAEKIARVKAEAAAKAKPHVEKPAAAETLTAPPVQQAKPVQTPAEPAP